MRKVLAVMIPLVLTGCGLPPAITLISYALDGVSLFSTGKTVGDHALSVAMNQDCKVWRVVNDQSVCRDLLPGESNALIAQAEEWQAGQEVVGQQDPLTPSQGPSLIQTISNDPVLVPDYLDGLVTGYSDILQSDTPTQATPAAFGMRMDVFGYAGDKTAKNPSVKSHARVNSKWNPPEESSDSLAAVRRAAAIQPASGKPAAKMVLSEVPRVVVLGSFGKPDNAARAALKWRDMGATVIRSRVGAIDMYRVVTAPFGKNDYVAELRRIRSIGFKDAWAQRLCGSANAKTDNCVSLQASASQ